MSYTELSDEFMEDYCRQHPDDPACQTPLKRKKQMLQQPQLPDKPPVRDVGEQGGQGGGEEQQEEQPVKPPVKPPWYPPWFPPQDGDKTQFPWTSPSDGDYTQYRGVRGGLDMYTKECNVCGATLPAGTNFCPRCSNVVEKIEKGKGGKGGPSGQGQGT